MRGRGLCSVLGNRVVDTGNQALPLFDRKIAVNAGKCKSFLYAVRPANLDFVHCCVLPQTKMHTKIIGRLEAAAAHHIPALAHPEDSWGRRSATARPSGYDRRSHYAKAPACGPSS